MVPTVIIKVAAALQVNTAKSDKSHLNLSEGKGVSQPRTALLSVSSGFFVTHGRFRQEKRTSLNASFSCKKYREEKQSEGSKVHT